MIKGANEIERIYGLLWLVATDDKRVHAARKIALSQIDREGQKRGIQWAMGQTDIARPVVR